MTAPMVDRAPRSSSRWRTTRAEQDGLGTVLWRSRVGGSETVALLGSADGLRHSAIAHSGQGANLEGTVVRVRLEDGQVAELDVARRRGDESEQVKRYVRGSADRRLGLRQAGVKPGPGQVARVRVELRDGEQVAVFEPVARGSAEERKILQLMSAASEIVTGGPKQDPEVLLRRIRALDRLESAPVGWRP